MTNIIFALYHEVDAREVASVVDHPMPEYARVMMEVLLIASRGHRDWEGAIWETRTIDQLKLQGFEVTPSYGHAGEYVVQW